MFGMNNAQKMETQLIRLQNIFKNLYGKEGCLAFRKPVVWVR